MVCGFLPVQVHHVTYVRLGRERPEDIVGLCDDCHYGAHALVNAGASLFTSVNDLERMSSVFVRAYGYEGHDGAAIVRRVYARFVLPEVIAATARALKGHVDYTIEGYADVPE